MLGIKVSGMMTIRIVLNVVHSNFRNAGKCNFQNASNYYMFRDAGKFEFLDLGTYNFRNAGNYDLLNADNVLFYFFEIGAPNYFWKSEMLMIIVFKMLAIMSFPNDG